MVDSTFQKMKSEKKIKVRKSQKVFSILPNPQKKPNQITDPKHFRDVGG